MHFTRLPTNMPEQLSFKFVRKIQDIDRADWQSLAKTDYPFIQYQFIDALESSGSVCSDTGWQANHLVGYQNDKLVVAMPLYIKHHSYGEYVFDFQWANAFHQSGIAYYPKLVSAVPFTPATGPRILMDEELDAPIVYSLVIEQLKSFALKNKLSSWHLLFPFKSLSAKLNEQDCMQRVGVQYHWFNRNYQNFSDFLGDFKLKKRKNIKRERNKIKLQGIKTLLITGKDISDSLWERFYLFYQVTYAKRSGHGGYLNLEFFKFLAKSMPEKIIMSLAEVDEQVVAAALFFKGRDTLYGRYWGCVAEYDFLHFELCYYLGIDYCIENNLQRFDAGAQGEHKIARGFVPITTYSNHWIQHSDFSQAIKRFLNEESNIVLESLGQLADSLPFKAGFKHSVNE